MRLRSLMDAWICDVLGWGVMALEFLSDLRALRCRLVCILFFFHFHRTHGFWSPCVQFMTLEALQ
jgi:hypothetical protein